VTGNPDQRHVSTSYVERQNLSMRMGMRRFTRLTNAFPKKPENHAHAIAIYFMHYNFVRIHQTLRVTPAMAAGVTDKLFEMADLVAIVDAAEEPGGARGLYKKRAEAWSYGPLRLPPVCMPAAAALAALVARASASRLSSGGGGSTGFLRNRPTNQRHTAMVASRVG